MMPGYDQESLWKKRQAKSCWDTHFSLDWLYSEKSYENNTNK